MYKAQKSINEIKQTPILNIDMTDNIVFNAWSTVMHVLFEETFFTSKPLTALLNGVIATHACNANRQLLLKISQNSLI